MVITTAGTTEKSGTLAKRKKLILHIYALMLALFALRWENNRKNCVEMEVNRLKLLIIFLLRIYLLSKSSAKTAFRADTLWEMGQRCSIKGSVSQERTSDATRCNWRYNTLHLLARTRSISPYNTLQCEIQRDVCPFWTLYRILFAGSWFSIPLTRMLVAFSAAKNRQPNHINMCKMWINIQDYSHAT